jgi:hypothetical protein
MGFDSALALLSRASAIALDYSQSNVIHVIGCPAMMQVLLYW